MVFLSTLLRLNENRIKRETMYQLRGMSKRQREDCGISEELLNLGIKGWPWRLEVGSSTPNPMRFDLVDTSVFQPKPKPQDISVKEVNTCSEAA